ncbi:MAG TPA: TAXI family TRAP transporter solute-binding subunit [Alphaproteobacteria bacterium]|nr:TAXI family TRAP transporter solute-binding subunit [Alphaproteobacteria bacterium]
MHNLAKYAAVLAVAAILGAKSGGAAQFITIGGGPTGGTYYAISTGMAKIFNEKLKDIEARVRATSGAFEAPVLASAGRIDLGPTNANLAVWAHEGSEVYKGKQQPNIALFMGGLAGGFLQVAVLEDSPIKTLAHLTGKRVAVGPQGNTTALMMAQLLGIYGIGQSDYTPVYVNYNDGFSALGDGDADAAIINTAPPVAAIKELSIRKSFRLLQVADDKRKAFLDKYPFYTQGVIGKAVYGLPEDVPTVGSANIIIVRKDMDADLVYSMVKAIYENLDELRASHPSAKAITLEKGPTGGLALHPGAERYFKEKGVVK